MACAMTSDDTVTFAQALAQRYGDALAMAADDERLVVGAPGADRSVEVKLPATRHIEQLTRRVALSGLRIECVGDVSEDMLHRLRQVRELDLSGNALPNWVVVADIVAKVPACEELLLSHNPQIAYPCDFPYCDVIAFKRSLHNLRTIVLANCGYEWSWVVCAALEVWPPTLQSLSLHGNCITDLTPPPSRSFACLQSLDLSANPLRDWRQVCCLASLPA